MDILGKLEAVEARYEELNRLLAEPQVLSNSSLFQKYSKEQASLTEIVSGYRRLKTIMRQIDESQEIQDDRSADPELREMAASEVDRLRNERADTEREIKLLLLPKDPNDERNVIFEVRAGTGGEEAALFAAELFRMYVRYAEGRRWKVEVLNTSETGIGGLKEVIASIEGRGAYSRLKYESGVHRVQRVPVTESGGRIHTSAVTVAMLPEAEDVEVQIDQKDLRIDTFCSSGPGGQSVNTTYSAVRITHLPSGLVVSCQDEKSQIKNKARAMKVLMARLLDKKRSEAEAERAKTRKEQVGTGDRSERIRTYNFPQNRVTDHRVGVTLHRLDAVMGGDLDEIIDALATAETAERLKSIEVEAGGIVRRSGEGLTFQDLRERGTSVLRDSGIPEAPRDAFLLLQNAAGLDAAGLLARLDQPPSDNAVALFRGFVARRAEREPAAMILGRTEFWGIPIRVAPDVLIPRPETEGIVEEALHLSARDGVVIRTIADIGTGSGCLAVALAAEFPDARIFAADISGSALDLARTNVEAAGGLGTGARDRGGSLRADGESVPGGRDRPCCFKSAVRPKGEIDSLAPEVSRWEPRAALDGGPDGLSVIRRLIEGARRFLRPGGFLVFEIGHDQGPGRSRSPRTVRVRRWRGRARLRPACRALRRRGVRKETHGWHLRERGRGKNAASADARGGSR